MFVTEMLKRRVTLLKPGHWVTGTDPNLNLKEEQLAKSTPGFPLYQPSLPACSTQRHSTHLFPVPSTLSVCLTRSPLSSLTNLGQLMLASESV